MFVTASQKTSAGAASQEGGGHAISLLKIQNRESGDASAPDHQKAVEGWCRLGRARYRGAKSHLQFLSIRKELPGRMVTWD